MANVLADKQTDKREGQKLYAPDLSMRGHKNTSKENTLNYTIRECYEAL